MQLSAMTKTIDISKSDTPASELISMTRDGNDIILAEDGRPLARVIPIPEWNGIRIPGAHPGAMVPAEDFDAPLPDSFWLGED